MLFTLHGLARCLKTIAALAQQSRHGLIADADPVAREQGMTVAERKVKPDGTTTATIYVYTQRPAPAVARLEGRE